MAKNIREQYYHGTIKKLVAVFGSLFNDIHYQTDQGVLKKVPIFYSPREHFLTIKSEKSDMYGLQTAMSLPRIGFEMTSMNYAPERMTNPLNRIQLKDGEWQYNRVAYDFTFMLYIAAKDFETSLKIVEQILPLFTPGLNVSINEIVNQKLDNDIALVLNSVQNDVEYQGTFDGQRVLTWTLQFTVKAYLYNPTKHVERIKEVITRLSTHELDRQYSSFTALVEPRIAEKDDPHTIIEHNDPRPDIFGDG